MKRWRYKDCSLYLGDWRELPLIPEVVVVSDPPYGIDHKKGRSGVEKADSKSISTTKKRFCQSVVGDSQFDDELLKSYSNIVLTGASHFYDKLPPGGSLHCWDKRGNYKPLDQADCDVIWCSKKTSSRVFHLVWRGICRHAEHKDKFLHPTQKPVALMSWMIDLIGAARVFDPYCGSGSTGVACVQKGIPFIGCEIVPEYYEIAKQRIRDAYQNKRKEKVNGQD